MFGGDANESGLADTRTCANCDFAVARFWKSTIMSKLTQSSGEARQRSSINYRQETEDRNLRLEFAFYEGAGLKTHESGGWFQGIIMDKDIRSK